MERLQDTYEAGGFVFQTKQEAEIAKRELEGIRFLKQKIDMENPQAVLAVYQNLMEQDLFETPAGYCFLKELREYLLMIPAVKNESIPKIPIRHPKTAEDEKRQKKEEQKQEKRKAKEEAKEKEKDRKERREKNADYRGRCHLFMLISLILFVSVVSMMVLAATSDNVNILNYENKIIDKYASWEQELEEREQTVKERERALENGE